ncbi:MAG TPA: hypothetical protein VK961_28700 [Chthoniobacter sp.]|nr:hypothetical protein [Chthoniobacter sp.]
MKSPSILVALLAAFLVITGASLLAKEPPAFPGQPHLNAALKHLTSAKEKVANDATAALGDLESARTDLSHAIHNKGTFQTIARQLTEQAKQYLEKGDADKASHKIEEAIQNVNRAGQTGDH